jgi:hypothetical protein
MNIANLHMNADLEQIAIARLYDGDPDVLMSSAEALRAHGSSVSLQYLWNRFEQWHEEWKRYEPELRDAWPSRFPEAQPLGMQAFVELPIGEISRGCSGGGLARRGTDGWAMSRSYLNLRDITMIRLTQMSKLKF